LFLNYFKANFIQNCNEYVLENIHVFTSFCSYAKCADWAK
jgi:hypothetical protein